jgi:hypothetical protein
MSNPFRLESAASGMAASGMAASGMDGFLLLSPQLLFSFSEIIDSVISMPPSFWKA